MEKKKKIHASRLDEVEKKNLSFKQTGRSGKKDLHIQANWMKWEEKNTFEQSG